MKRWCWIDGRLPWLFVAMVAFVSASAVGFDFAWRVLVLPFESLIIWAALIDTFLAILFVSVYLTMKRTHRPRSR